MSKKPQWWLQNLASVSSKAWWCPSNGAQGVCHTSLTLDVPLPKVLSDFNTMQTEKNNAIVLGSGKLQVFLVAVFWGCLVKDQEQLNRGESILLGRSSVSFSCVFGFVLQICHCNNGNILLGQSFKRHIK